MSKHLIVEKTISAHSGSLLIRELRESQPYLACAGWHQVGKLILAAADEIEHLQARIRQLETASFVRRS